MFESIMWTYMKEEPVLLANLLERGEIRRQISRFQSMDALYMIAHGSSYNAASTVAPMISRLGGVRVYAYTPSNFRFNAVSQEYESKADTWILGISQTGTSRGVLEAMELAGEKGFHSIGITNEPDSPIDRLSDVTFYLGCGEEDSNAKTKGYSSTLLTLMLFAIELGSAKGRLSRQEADAYYAELRNEIAEIGAVIERTTEWCKEHDYGRGMNNLYVVGNGMNFATAMEGQLKLMETQCVPTMFNDIEEFSHGMHRSLTLHSNVILLNSREDQALTEKTMEYLRSKEIPALMINGMKECTEPDVINAGYFPLTNSVLTMTAALQAISAFVPELNGMDPNRSANNDYTEWVRTRV